MTSEHQVENSHTDSENTKNTPHKGRPYSGLESNIASVLSSEAQVQAFSIPTTPEEMLLLAQFRCYWPALKVLALPPSAESYMLILIALIEMALNDREKRGVPASIFLPLSLHGWDILQRHLPRGDVKRSLEKEVMEFSQSMFPMSRQMRSA